MTILKAFVWSYAISWVIISTSQRHLSYPTNTDVWLQMLLQVKVILRVCPTDGTAASVLRLDSYKKQVTVYEPSVWVTSLRRPLPPKMFAFDAIFDQDDSLVITC